MSVERKQVTKHASSKTGMALTQEIQQMIDNRNGKLICKALNKRPVFLGKYLDATVGRRDQTRRKQVFSACLELIKQAAVENASENSEGIEILGLSADGEKIGVHIREEDDLHNNRRLFLISTFRG